MDIRPLSMKELRKKSKVVICCQKLLNSEDRAVLFDFIKFYYELADIGLAAQKLYDLYVAIVSYCPEES